MFRVSIDTIKVSASCAYNASLITFVILLLATFVMRFKRIHKTRISIKEIFIKYHCRVLFTERNGAGGLSVHARFIHGIGDERTINS